MVLSKLRGAPAAVRARLPGGSGDARDRVPGVPDAVPSVPAATPDADDLPAIGDGPSDRLAFGLTLLSLAGVALAAVGIVARLLVERGGDGGGEDSPPDPTADPPAPDEPAVDAETPLARERGADEIGDRDARAGSTVADASEGEGVESVTTGETSIPATGTTDAAGSDESDESEPTGPPGSDREFPKVAPLVGIGALVAMRLVVERLRADDADA